MDKNILKQLKTDYEDLEIKPSVNLWNQIESELDETEETVQKPFFQWWKYAAVIVLLISLGGGLLYFNSHKNSKFKETVAVEKPLENNFKPTETVKPIIQNKNITQNQTDTKTKINANKIELNSVSDVAVSKNESPKKLAVVRQELKTIEVPIISTEKFEIRVTKPLVAEKKKASYISANDLLLGRELDKTREEASDSRQFGILEASKLKIKRPHTLRIFGVKVFADSTSVQ